MKLRQIVIDRMPGIDQAFSVKEFGGGLNIILGPNGIGKSQLCAAVRALLWPDRGNGDHQLTARAVFGHEGELWSVVRDGTVHGWQRGGVDSDPPALPGEWLEGCFFLGLRDLLDDSDRAGRRLAEEIRRQMSGGFDLEAVQQSCRAAVPPQIGRAENKAIAAAEKEIRQAQQSQAEVERGEGELEELRNRASQAARASSRIDEIKAALSLQVVRGELAQRQNNLAKMPAALVNLDGKEVQRLDELDEELLRKRGEAKSAVLSLAKSREAVTATRLAGTIDSVALATWRERAEKLRENERLLDAARLDHQSACQSVEQCRRTLGDHRLPKDWEDTAGRAVGLDESRALFEFLKESERLAIKIETLRERLSLLSARSFSFEEAKRLELLKRGVPPLRAWLRAPDSAAEDRVASFWPSRRIHLTVGGLLIAAGVLLVVVISSLATVGPGMLAIGLGTGLVVSGVFSRTRIEKTDASQSTDWRGVAERQFPEALESPEAWRPEVVEARLDALEDQVASLDASEKRARDRQVERGPFEETLKGLESRFDELQTRRDGIAAGLGLDSLRSDAELVDLAQAIVALRETTVAARAAETVASALEASTEALLTELAETLIGLGESGPVDSASCRAGVHSLEQRDRALRIAVADGLRAEEDRDRLDLEIERLAAAKCELFATAGIENQDRLALLRTLEELPRYRALRLECADFTSRSERLLAELESADGSALVDREPNELIEETTALEEQAAARDQLREKIGGIRTRVRNAKEGHALEEVIAKKTAALRSLRERRDEALIGLAGEFLIDQVRREHETNQMPRVLARARARFSVFTDHRYELKVSAEGGGSFIAVEGQSGQGLRPEQLSDGTRAQLILAARLAFAEEAEQGADLPIFLDEAMDHSDPERFHAIACSLARMVMEDERQIFYLSNDPVDAERFQRAFEKVGCRQWQTIDLGLIRGELSRVESPAALRVLPLAEIEPPGDRDAASYGAAIGVSALLPWEPLGSQPLFYVLNQDLTLLYELLVDRISTIGQWRNLAAAGSDLAKSVVAREPAGAELEDRIALLETFSQAWREGRGRAVGRTALERSSAISSKYLQTLVEIADELDGDAGRLIEALQQRDDSRLSGYRKKATDDLQHFFEEEGYLDVRSSLDVSEITERALGTPAANRLSPGLVAQLVHEWWGLTNKQCRGER